MFMVSCVVERGRLWNEGLSLKKLRRDIETRKKQMDQIDTDLKRKKEAGKVEQTISDQ